MTTAHDEHKPGETNPDDAGIEELLRQVGARDEPSQDMMREVHAAVHSEWLAMLEERRKRRRRVISGIAASFAFALVVATLGLRFIASEAVPIATITRVDGQLLAGAGNDRRSARDAGQTVAIGESIRTGDRSRASMKFADNLSLRLDHDTTVTMASADRVVLASGALYVDSPPGSPDTALTVQAHAASIQHVGTQYEVRTHAGDIEVSVREGRVVISNPTGTHTGRAGEMIRMTPQGAVARTTIAPHDPRWHWATSIAPVFDINDQPLSAFLNWVARETGRRLVYSSPQAEAAASQVKLRGSIKGLEPDTALAAVLATTRLQRYQTKDELIGIRLATSD